MKRANGEGSYREIKKDKLYQGRIMIDGHTYTRYGKTRDEVRRKIMSIRTSADTGCLPEPTKLTVEEWLLVWLDTYSMVKKSSQTKYESVMRNHLFPAIGDVPLQKLTTQHVQRMYNRLLRDGKEPKTIKDIHGILHKPLEKAVRLGYLQRNVCDACDLPKVEKKEMRPLIDSEILQFLQAIKGTRYEALFYVAMFTGMRQGELIGLTWDCINFERGTIRLYQQLQSIKQKGDQYAFGSLKNGQARTIEPAATVMDVLRKVKTQQIEWQQRCGDVWDNPHGLVFTNEIGGHLCHYTVFKHFKKVVKGIGLKEVRFHDLRHTFAVLSLQSGADMESVSKMMGHATVAFTMDRYGHVSNTMRTENARRMQRFIDSLA